MEAIIKIECDTYEDLQEILSDIKKAVRKHKNDIWEEKQPEIRLNEADCLGNTYDVEIIVYDEFERSIDQVNNPSRYEEPGVLTLNFES